MIKGVEMDAKNREANSVVWVVIIAAGAFGAWYAGETIWLNPEYRTGASFMVMAGVCGGAALYALYRGVVAFAQYVRFGMGSSQEPDELSD